MENQNDKFDERYKGSLDEPAVLNEPATIGSTSGSGFGHRRLTPFSFNKLAFGVTTVAVVAILGISGLAYFLVSSSNKKSDSNTPKADKYSVSSVSTSGVQGGAQLQVGQADYLAVNGQLQVSKTLVITPTSTPTAPMAGQIYFDKTTTTPYYYNGKEFVSLKSQTTSIQGITGSVNVGGGISLVNSTLVNSGVISIQGQTGAVNFAGGSGIAINGSTITNTGVLGIAGNPSQLVVTSGANGNVQLQIVGIQDGGVLIGTTGNGINTVLPTAGGQCLISDPSTQKPVFGSCSGAPAVTGITVGSATLTNTVMLQGAGGITVTQSGQTVTIDGSSIAPGGDVSFGSTHTAGHITMLDTNGNLVNSDISQLSGGLQVQSGNYFVDLANAGASTLTIKNSTGGNVANLTVTGVVQANGGIKDSNGNLYAFATTPSGSSRTICYVDNTNLSNCPTGGNVATTGTPTIGTLARFTGSSTIGNSIISDNGSTVSIGGDLSVNAITAQSLQSAGALNITAAGTISIGAANQVLSLQGNASSTLVVNSNGHTMTLGFAPLATTNRAITFPDESGVVCLQGSTACGFAGGGSGVTSLNGLAGTLTIANASAAGSTITLNNASTSAKGIASFNASDFTVASGVVSTIQPIDTTATVTFGSLTLGSGGNLNISPTGTLYVDNIQTTLSGGGSLSIASDGPGSNITFAINGGTDTFTFPTGYGAGQQICTTSSGCASGTGLAVILEPQTGAQSATGNQSAIYINRTGGSGNLIQLQAGGTDAFVIDSSGNTTIANTVHATGDVTVDGTLTTNTIASTGALTIGSQSKQLILQGSGTSTLSATSSGNTTTVGFTTPTGNNSILFPDASGTICLSLPINNCGFAAGGSGISGSGTIGKIAKFTGSNAVGDSLLSETGSVVTVSGSLAVGVASSINGTIVVQNSTNANTITIQQAAAPGSNLTLKLPTQSGTFAVAATGPLSLDPTTGQLSCATCLTSGGGGGTSGVVSVNGLSGALSINNATGSGSSITIDDASTSVKGIASFNSTNFTASGGVINLVQDIATTSSPTFANLSLQGASGLTVGSASNLGQIAFKDGTNDGFTSTFRPSTLTANQILTIPNASGTLAVSASGNLSLSALGNLTISNSPTFSTSVTTPLLQSAGALAITPGGTLTIGATGQSLALQGNGSTTLSATVGSNKTVVGFVTPSGNRSITFPDESGVVCLQNSTNCGFAGGGSGVTSLNTLTGALTIANSTTSPGTITLNNAAADGSTKGIAAFNSSNFSAASGVINTIQNIDTAATPTFGGLTLSGLSTGVVHSSVSGVLSSSSIVNSDLQAGTFSNITGTGALTAGSIASGFGTISTGNNITTTATVQGDTLNGTSAIQLNGTSINTAGTLTNVAYLNQANIFTGSSNTFNNGVVAKGGITLGQANSSSGTLTIANSTTSNNIVLQGLAPSGTGDATLQIPVLAGGSTYTICYLTGSGGSNCTGAGGGVTTSTGSSNYVARFTGSTTLGIGQLLDSGSAAYVGNTAASGGGLFNVGSSNQFQVSSAGVITAVGVNSGSGLIQGTGGLTVGGTVTLSGLSTGVVHSSVSGVLSSSSIVNSDLQAGTFSNITGTGALTAGSIASGFGTISTGNNITTTATIQGGTVNATSALQLNGTSINTAGTLTNVAYLNGTGPQTFTGDNKFTGTVAIQGVSNSTSELSVLNTNGKAVSTFDTTNGQLVLGDQSAVNGVTGKLVFNTANNTSAVTLQAGATSASYTLTLPTAVGSANQCLTAGGVGSESQLQFQSCSGGSFVNGGNSFGAATSLGTNDNNSLSFRTNNANRLTLDTSGNLQFLQASTLSVASATTGTQLTIQGGTATSGTNAGGNLLLQGGAGASTGASGSVIVKSNTNNSTTAFQVQNAAGAALLTADTANLRVAIGSKGTATAQLYVAGNTPSGALSASNNSVAGAYGLAIQGRYAYVTPTSGTGLLVYDISNPAASPLPLVSSVATTSSANKKVKVQGKYAYVAGGGTLQVFDISNPKSPVSVGSASYTSGTNIPSIYVQGRYAYIGDSGTPTLYVFDVSSPTVPSLASSVAVATTSNGPAEIYVQGRYAYIVNGGTNRFQIVDVSNPLSPALTGTVTSTNITTVPTTLAVQGRYAYAGTSVGSIYVIDVSDPSAPAVSTSVSLSGGSTHSLAVQGRYLYAGDANNGVIRTIDISTPASASLLSGTTTASAPLALVADGRYVYAANNTSGVMLQSFDFGGAYTQQLEAGGVATDTLSVRGNTNFASDVAIQGSLGVGTGLQVAGTSGFSGAVGIQTNSASAFQVKSSSGSAVVNVDTSNSIFAANGTIYSGGTISQAGNAVAGTGTSFSPAMVGGTIFYNDGTSGTVVAVSSTTLLTSSASKTVASGSSYSIYYGGFRTSSTGATQVQTTTNSASAFQVQNAFGANLLTVDTTSNSLIYNGTFDSTVNGWSASFGYGSVAWSSSGVTAGSALMIFSNGTNGDFISTTLSSPTVVGQSYTLSFYAKKSSGGTDTLSANFGGGSVSCGSISNTASFVQFTCTRTATSASTSFSLSGGTTTSGEFMDNITLLPTGATLSVGNIIANATITGVSATTTNTAGSALTLAGGAGVGNGVGGDINLQIAKPGSSGSLVNLQTTVVNISGSTGAASFKNATDSTAGFQIQNASSASIFTADTTNSSIYVNQSNTGGLNAWATTGGSIARESHATVTANGYIYSIGGYDGSSTVNAVSYAKINADGTVGSWTSTQSLSSARFDLGAVAVGGYVYAVGGELSSGTEQSTVEYAKINADGTLGSWVATTSLPSPLSKLSVVTANGYIYAIAGRDGSHLFQQTVYYAKIGADGKVGAWNTTTALGASDTKGQAAAAVANGYMYVIGGTTNSQKVMYSKINTNGTIGAWSTSSNSLPAARYGASPVVTNGYIYIIGGTTNGTTPQSTVYYSKLATNGDVGAWATNSYALGCATAGCGSPAPRIWSGAVTANGYVYVTGGNNGTGGPSATTSTVYYASTARLNIGANLDLVSYSGQNLSEGGTGGELTAGNTHVIGALDVQAQATFKQGVSIGDVLNVSGNTYLAGTLTVTGSATFNAGITVNGHIVTGNSTGSTAFAGTSGAGAVCSVAPTVTASVGNDTAGMIVIDTTPGGCAASDGTSVTVTFAGAYGAAPQVVATPANSNAADRQVYIDSSNVTTGSFKLSIKNGLANSTTYRFYYYVLQ